MTSSKTTKEQHHGSRQYVFSAQVGHLMRKAYQRHLAIFQDNTCDKQLTSVQFSVLCALRELGASSQSELVRATAVDQATIRGIIERLLKRKLIVLSKDGGDARKIIIDLTKAGRALLEKMDPCGHRITELTIASLNEAERVALLYLLQKLGQT